MSELELTKTKVTETDSNDSTEKEEIKDNISISADILSDKTDFESVNLKMSGGLFIIGKPGTDGKPNSYEVWNNRIKYTQAGIADNTKAVAILFTISIDTSDSNSVSTDVERYAQNLMKASFGNDINNLLLIYEIQDNTCYELLFLCFPLDNRVLNIQKWMYGKNIKKNVEHEFLLSMVAKFPFLHSSKILDNAGGELLPGYVSSNPWTEEDMHELTYHPNTVSVQTDCTSEEMERKFSSLLEFCIFNEAYKYTQIVNGEVDEEKYRNHLMTDILNAQGKYSNLSALDKNVLCDKVINALFSFYAIENEINNDDDVTDVDCLSDQCIRVKRFGMQMTSTSHFLSPADYYQFVQRLARRNGFDITDPANSILYFSDKNSSKNYILRINIVSGRIPSLSMPQLQIRKESKVKKSIDYLIGQNMLDRSIANYLIDQVKNSHSLLFVGEGGSGKTTLMNALIEYIPYYKSILVIQQAEELFADKHPHCKCQTEVVNRRNPDMQYLLKDLGVNGLLTSVDYYVIGEIKGDESLYFSNALMTTKAWSSVHGDSIEAGPEKITDYIMSAKDSKYTKPQANIQLKHLQTIIYMKGYQVAGIGEVTGYNPETESLCIKHIYR